MEEYTPSTLITYIKSHIPSKRVKVSGEVSQPKISGGNLYFGIKDKNSTIKSIVWRSRLNEMPEIKEGSKITVKAKPDLYLNGTISLIVDDCQVENSNGDLYKELEETKKYYMENGYFDDERKKQLSSVIKSILIITSKNGAAIHDFLINLENNNSNIKYEICDVAVQGQDCPRAICDVLYLLKNEEAKFDAVVITRGGGSFEDLYGFSKAELIEAVYNFHLPVISAIGHQVDNPLLDLVADYHCATPSLASQFIIDWNNNNKNALLKRRNKVREIILENISRRLDDIRYIRSKMRGIYNSLKDEIKKTMIERIYNTRLYLSGITNEGITIYDGNAKVNKDEIESGKSYDMIWNDRVFRIKIE